MIQYHCNTEQKASGRGLNVSVYAKLRPSRSNLCIIIRKKIGYRIWQHCLSFDMGSRSLSTKHFLYATLCFISRVLNPCLEDFLDILFSRTNDGFSLYLRIFTPAHPYTLLQAAPCSQSPRGHASVLLGPARLRLRQNEASSIGFAQASPHTPCLSNTLTREDVVGP